MDGALVLLAFIAIVLVTIGLWRSLRGRRARGTSFSTLPWYLGGPREIELPHPPDDRKSSKR